MKKCEYCGKEISYFDQYCSEDCEREAIKFYEFRQKYTIVFSIINSICVFGIPVGLLVFGMIDFIGFSIIAISLTILGFTVYILPFPTESMVHKKQLKKSIKFARILGLCILLTGIVCSVIDIILFFA